MSNTVRTVHSIFDLMCVLKAIRNLDIMSDLILSLYDCVYMICNIMDRRQEV